MKLNVDFMHPVGSIYTSSVNVSPQNLLGGTWTPITRNYLDYVPGTEISSSVPASQWFTLSSITLSPGTWFICGTAWRHWNGADATIRFSGGAPESRQSFYCGDGNVYSATTSCVYTNTEQKTIYLQTWTATAGGFTTSSIYAYRLNGLSPELYVWQRTA